jgi:Protein of unknown function (DUF2938)
MLLPQDLARVALIGVGATVLMDAWLLAQSRLGLPTSNFALIGRWVGHWRRGRFVHVSIADAEPIRAELALGWLTHYLIGIAYAAALVGALGLGWARQPTPLPALAFGVVTVVAPLFVMQPAMGAGFAASKTPTPLKNCLRSLANHTVFGAGLYFAAAFIAWISR